MSDVTGGSGTGETADTVVDAAGAAGVVTVRYWASARWAAGVETDEVPVDGPLSLAEVTRRAGALHDGTRLPQVLSICSVLVGEKPAGTNDPETVTVSPGDRVEYLPPFAGG
ncbi:MoaD/ThiS family protein [Nocardioides sp. GCM10027113]|uniref:MoaD/ThiS family protein n=1 Tax=unclassified Nocardioides TaxID=2615069 RepID=UPI0036098173